MPRRWPKGSLTLTITITFALTLTLTLTLALTITITLKYSGTRMHHSTQRAAKHLPRRGRDLRVNRFGKR